MDKQEIYSMQKWKEIKAYIHSSSSRSSSFLNLLNNKNNNKKNKKRRWNYDKNLLSIIVR